MLRFQADLDESRVLAGIAGVDGRQVGRHSDVGDDHLQVIFADDLANVVSPPGRCTALVISSREPVGAFTLMTNCPGSVRGKKATPSNGDNARLTTNVAHDDDHGRYGTRQRFIHGSVVLHQHLVVVAIEGGNEASEQRLAL